MPARSARAPLFVVFLLACGRPDVVLPPRVDPREPAHASPPAETQARASEAPAPRTFADELAALDRRLASATRLAEAQPRSFSARERVAGGYLARARLSGDYADYARAEAWIGRAFAVDEAGELGPFLARARLNYTLHRLDRCDADLAAARVGLHDDIARASHELFAGNLALQRGAYAEARTRFLSSRELHESIGNLSALAQLHAGTGELDEAETLLRAAMARYHGESAEPLAWMHLQLGLMDLGRGRWHEALAHYRDADGVLSGWWLVDEHIAEVLLLLGETDEAEARYAELVTRTNNPEFMDALAEISFAQGATDEAGRLVARADARYRELMAQFPEAAYGHALEHWLAYGDDAAFVVDLAERNHALRPNTDAKVLLARAYLKGERIADARRVIEAALATVWRTADVHVTAAQVYRALGRTSAADEQLARARALDPHATE